MTLHSQSSSQSAYPLRWRHTLIFCCLVVLGGLLTIEHKRLSALATQIQDSAQSDALSSVHERLGHLEQQVEASAHRPSAITPSDLDTLRQPLEGRLSQLEQKQTASAAQELALQALQERLNRLETRPEQRQPLATSMPTSAPARQPTVKVTKPRIIAPPFSLLGVELRGGERFLSVTSGSATSLSQVRLLRPGESENGWRLETLEGQTAVFRINGQTQRLSIP